ncbi:MAG: glycoside hydrolase family 38 N-terminal domain-containing protein, partial [Planctomycetota bacterium]
MSDASTSRVAEIFSPDSLAADAAAWDQLVAASGVAPEQAAFGAVARHDILAALAQPDAAVLAGFYYRDNNADGTYTPGEAFAGTLLGVPTVEGGGQATVTTYGNCYVAAPLTPGATVTLVYDVDGVEPVRQEITLTAGLNVLHLPIVPTGILVYIICHSHFDPEWRDTYEGYLDRELPQLVDRIELLRDQSEYVFQMDEELAVRPLVERYPQLRDELRQRVIDGDIEMKGVVTAGELTMPLGESIIRQFTEGEWWASELLGIDIRPVTAWNVDCYGINYQWPQILKQAGR